MANNQAEPTFFDEFKNEMDFILGKDRKVDNNRLITSANERRDALIALGYSYEGEFPRVLRLHGNIARGIPDIHRRTLAEYLKLKFLLSNVLPDSPESEVSFKGQTGKTVMQHKKNQKYDGEKDSLCNDKFDLSYILGREIDAGRLEREAKKRRNALKVLGYSYNSNTRQLEGDLIERTRPDAYNMPDDHYIIWNELEALDWLHSHVYPHAPIDKLLVF